MSYEEYLASFESSDLPAGLSPALRALWLTRKDRWAEAHEVVEDLSGTMGCWIHAHLHLIEGDLGNAAYWYAKAGKPARRDQKEIPAEWEELVRANLSPSEPS